MLKMERGPDIQLRSQPWQVASWYALVGVLWILGSDWLVEVLLPENWWVPAQAYKGVAFVTVTATALLLALQRYQAKVERVHQQLELGRERYRQFFQQSPVGVFELDAGGNLVSGNPAFRQLLGMETSSQGSFGAFLTEPDVWDGLWVAVNRGLEAPSRLVTLRTHDGGRRRCELKLFGIRDDVSLTGARGFLIDHTVLLELQETMTQRERLDAVGRLAGGVAHDFNNILTAIMGYAELLEVSALEPQAQEGVQGLKRAAEKAGAITRQLLVFSAKDRGPAEVVELNRSVRAMTDVLGRILGERVKLEFRACDTPLRVRIAPPQLDQILLNLVVNARDAMPDGGLVTIRLEPAEMGVDLARAQGLEPGPFAQISVGDTGVGISAEVMSHLFEPFFSTKGKGRGTGLGLATVFGAAKAASGHVSVESEPGRGSWFRVFLPRVEPTPESQEMGALLGDQEAEVEPGTPERQRILVVDDHDDVREMMVHVLESAGYEVLERADGGFLGRNEKLGPIHAAIIDLTLPDQAGTELAAPLRRMLPGVRVLYTSGYRRGSRPIAGLLAPSDPLLEKPFAASALLEAIRRVLNRPANER